MTSAQNSQHRHPCKSNSFVLYSHKVKKRLFSGAVNLRVCSGGRRRRGTPRKEKSKKTPVGFVTLPFKLRTVARGRSRASRTSSPLSILSCSDHSARAQAEAEDMRSARPRQGLDRNGRCDGVREDGLKEAESPAVKWKTTTTKTIDFEFKVNKVTFFMLQRHKCMWTKCQM